MIRYESGDFGTIQIQSKRGTIPADRMRTLSSQPFQIFPAGFFSAQQYFIPISASANMRWDTAGLAFPMGLTFDISVQPYFEMSPLPAGGGMVTAAPSPYLIIGGVHFDINNLNDIPKPQMVWKAIADSPLADFFDVPYEILYIVRDVLTV